MNGVIALSRSEILQLLRNKTTAGMALLLPLVMGAFLLFGTGVPDWDLTLTLQLVAAQALTVYISATTAFAGRRQDLSLKRLRTGELSDVQILGGVLAPFVALGLVQCLLLTAASLIAGAPAPDPLPYAAAVLGGVTVNAAAALLTSSFTATPEAAQITTAPFFFAGLGGAIWLLATDPGQVTRWILLLPGGAVADLVRGPALGLWQPVAVLVVWTVVGWSLGTRHVRWDRRG
ncbi:ABC transporter permease [Actinokineospora enzanensis]|uniref:ABC transporter permease n=1 Tax=Actinokineospora enzanensis TaxID=155975 RepID=UPI00036B04D5|nr:ABC transporter permease [Actinokineospora enzanensis]